MKLYQILLTFSLLFVLPVLVYAQTTEDLKLAKMLEKSGRYEEALNLYNKMFDPNRLQIQVISGISECLTGLHRYEDLIKFDEELLKKNPYHYNYRVELGKAYYLNGNVDEAFKNWKMVYENQPDNISAYRLVAITLIEFRLFDQAIEVYKKILNRFEDQNSLYRDIANLYRAQLDYNGAVTNLLFFYKYYKNQSEYIKSQFVAMSADDEAVQKIIAAIQNFTEHEFSDDTIQEFLATMYVKNKEYDKAFNIYKSMQDNNSSALATYAALVEKNKVYKYAVLAYKMLIDALSSNAMVPQYKLDLARNQYLLAMQQVSNDQLKVAEENIESSVRILDEISNQNQIMFQIRSLELKGEIYFTYYQDLDQAINIYKQILEKNSRSDAVDNIKIKLGLAYIIKNDPDEARKYYAEVKGKKYKTLSLYYLAELDYFEGKFSLAKKEYQHLVSDISPKDSLTNNILDRMILITQASTDSIALLDYAQAEFTEKQLKKSEAAKKFLEIFKKENKLSFKAGIAAGILYKQLGKFEESQSILNNVIQNFPDNDGIDQVYFLLGEIYYQEENYQNSLQSFQKILLNYPGSFYLEDARDKARIISGIIENENAK